MRVIQQVGSFRSIGSSSHPAQLLALKLPGKRNVILPLIRQKRFIKKLLRFCAVIVADEPAFAGKHLDHPVIIFTQRMDLRVLFMVLRPDIDSRAMAFSNHRGFCNAVFVQLAYGFFRICAGKGDQKQLFAGIWHGGENKHPLLASVTAQQFCQIDRRIGPASGDQRSVFRVVAVKAFTAIDFYLDISFAAHAIPKILCHGQKVGC